MAHQHHLRPARKYRDLPIREDNSDNVPTRLLNAAWNALHSKPAADISLRELAAEVGVSQPAAYNHFRDKQELFANVANEGLGTLIGQIADLWPDGSSSVQGILGRVCEVWVGFARARPRHYLLMFSLEFMDPARFPAITKRREKLTEFFEVLAAQELGFEPRPEQALMLVAMIHGAACLVASGGPKLPIAALNDALELYFAGLRARRGRSPK